MFGTGCGLAEAVEVDERVQAQPVVHVDGEMLELGEGRHAAADREQRQVGEDPDQRRQLAHGEAPMSLRRGRYQRIASSPDSDQDDGHGEMQHRDACGCQRHEHEIVDPAQGFTAQLDGNPQHQSHGRGADRVQHRRNHRFAGMLAIGHADHEHQQPARQADGDGRRYRARGTAQPVTGENRDVGRVEAGQALADREHAHEGRVVEPAVLVDQAVAQVGDHPAADAGGADQQERAEDLEQRHVDRPGRGSCAGNTLHGSVASSAADIR